MFRAFTAILSAAVVFAAGCSRQERRLSVGSKNFTEQLILGEIAAQHLERRLGKPVERKLNLGGTLLAHQAILNGDIDIYPEYTGTALTAILKYDLETDPAIVRERVRDSYRDRLHLEWMPPLGFDNTFVMVIRGEDARALRMKTLSDAAAHAKGWRLGVGYEFQERPDGMPVLMKTYRLPWAAAPRSMDLGLLYRSLEEKQVTMVAGNATDGVLAKLDVQVLRDDRRAFPPYEACYVARSDSLRLHPGLREALTELSGKFTADVMRSLNFQVDAEHKGVVDVAAGFLRRSGLQ